MEWSRDGLEAARATSAALRASSQEWGRRAAEQGPCPSSAWCMGRGGAPEDGVHCAVRLLEETNIREAHGCGGNLDLDKSICRAR